MSVLDKLELTSRESITRPKQLFIESKQASEL